MGDKKKTESMSPWWRQFLTTMLATSIGLGLTFAINRMVENNKRAKAQRTTAITVIDDIDMSIATLKNIRDHEEKGYYAALYLSERLDSLDAVPDSTLNLVFHYLCEGSVVSTEHEFDESVEKMYHGAQEARSNLSDVPFIRNVEDFYKSRALTRNVIGSFAYWRKPVSNDETNDVLMSAAIMNAREGFCDFLKSKLTEERCKMYIKKFVNRIQFYNSTLEEWINMNEENKFLMNITDKELKEFIEETSKQVTAARKSDIRGQWISSGPDTRVTEFHYRHDDTFTHYQTYSINHPLASGKATLKVSYSGRWSIKGDSLILDVDPQTMKVNVDGSTLSYRKEWRDSILHDLQVMKDKETPVIRQQLLSGGLRKARATNIDKSGTRLELTDSEQHTTHYLRQQE